MWLEITLRLSAKRTIEIHEQMEEHEREVLTIDKMPDSPKLWLNLSTAMAIQVLEEQVIIYYPPADTFEVHEPDEIAKIHEFLQIGSDDNDDDDGWEDMTE